MDDGPETRLRRVAEIKPRDSNAGTTETQAMYSNYSTSRNVTAPRMGKSGASGLRAPVGQFLTMEQIRNVTPSVFAEEPHASRSEKYAYIPTSAILERLGNEGFRPVQVAQGGSRDEEKKGFTKHSIRLRHEDLKLTVRDQVFSEICLFNSHDGTSSYGMTLGPFRLACLNGMVVSQGTVAGIKVPHKGDIISQVIDGCIEIMGHAPELSDSIREMESLELSAPEQAVFARAALTARYDEASLAPITPADVLQTRRSADHGADLWRTLNRVQENIIRGGVSYVQRDANGRRVARRQTRPINGIDQNTSVNRALWQLAEEMKAIRAGI